MEKELNEEIKNISCSRKDVDRVCYTEIYMEPCSWIYWTLSSIIQVIIQLIIQVTFNSENTAFVTLSWRDGNIS